MINNTANNSEAIILRKRAVALLKEKNPMSGSQRIDDESLKLIHEMEVQQIELELQNVELMLAKSKVKDVLEKYTELYDFAPTGYFTLSKEGKIIELNLCGSQMLGKERSFLINNLFGFFISTDTKLLFNLFLEKAFNNNTKVSCKVSLSNDVNLPRYVYLTGIVTEYGKKCLVTAVDITRQSQTEQALVKAKEKAEESDRLKSAILSRAFAGNIKPEIVTINEKVMASGEVEKKIKKLKILIAEDDESSAMLQTIIVDKICREVLYATTGIEAVEACRNNHDIDLILMDIQMPEMSGHEATREIRQFNKDIVIIAQTAYVNNGDREKAIAAGCNDYISKPYNHALMLALIKKHLK